MPLNALAVTCINARYRYWGRHILRPMKLWCSSTHSLAEPEAGAEITTRRTWPAPGWGLRESGAIAASDTYLRLCLGGWAALGRVSGRIGPQNAVYARGMHHDPVSRSQTP